MPPFFSLLQVISSQILRKKQIFYRDFADGTFRCKDGNIIKANKAFLSAKSEILQKLVTKPEGKVIDIPDYDKQTFELYFNCLMGFQKCSFEDALKVFPIAVKFETFDLIQECITILTPSVLNKDVALVLNLAVTLSENLLLTPVLDFLKNKRLIYKLLDDEQLCALLEPKAIFVLMGEIDPDSYILEKICEWGEQYLKNHNDKTNLKSFLDKHDISRYFYIGCFESYKSYFDFIKSDTRKNFFSSENFQNHMQVIGYDPYESTWVKVNAGETVTEYLIIPNLAHLNNYITQLTVAQNKVIFHDYPENDQAVLISYDYCLHFDTIVHDGFKMGFESLAFQHFDEEGLTTDLKINLCKNIVADLKIKIDYSFYYDCRILKMSPNNFKADEEHGDMLFFTKSVDVGYTKK